MVFEDLTMDYLKANKQRLYYFGLGFVQLVISPIERLHFYNVGIEKTNDEIHNHRYNFGSMVLKGCLKQTKWDIDILGDTHILTNESCSKERQLTNVIEIEIGVKKIKEEKFFDSQFNFISFNEFHSVDYDENTITILDRSPIITEYAQVIYPKGKDITCPFSKTYTEDELWEIIEETIKY